MSYEFTLNDFRAHLDQFRKEGIENLISRTPAMARLMSSEVDTDAALGRVQGMIDAMTPEERADPGIIDRSRRRRIAAGAGVKPCEVGQFLKRLDTVRTIQRRMMSMSVWQRVLSLFGFMRFRPPPPS